MRHGVARRGTASHGGARWGTVGHGVAAWRRCQQERATGGELLLP